MDALWRTSQVRRIARIHERQVADYRSGLHGPFGIDQRTGPIKDVIDRFEAIADKEALPPIGSTIRADVEPLNRPSNRKPVPYFVTQRCRPAEMSPICSRGTACPTAIFFFRPEMAKIATPIAHHANMMASAGMTTPRRAKRVYDLNEVAAAHATIVNGTASRPTIRARPLRQEARAGLECLLQARAVDCPDHRSLAIQSRPQARRAGRSAARTEGWLAFHQISVLPGAAAPMHRDVSPSSAPPYWHPEERPRDKQLQQI